MSNILNELKAELSQFTVTMPGQNYPHVYIRFLKMIEFFGMRHDSLRGTASLNVSVPGITGKFVIIVEVFRSQDETLRFFPKVQYEDSLFHDNELNVCPEEALKSAIAYLKDRIEIIRGHE